MFNQLIEYIKNVSNNNKNNTEIKKDEKTSKELAKQRLHVLLVQDRASVSSDFIDIMKDEIMEVVAKYVILKTDEVEMDITTTINNEGQKTDTGILLKIPFENVRNEMKSEIMKQEQEKIEKKFEEKKKEALSLNTPEELVNSTLNLDKTELEFDITASMEELRQLELLKEQFKKQNNKEVLTTSDDEVLLGTDNKESIKKTINEIEKNTKSDYTKVIEVETSNNDENGILEDIEIAMNKKNEEK